MADNGFGGIDVIATVFENNNQILWLRHERRETWEFEEERMMKTISAIALLVGMAASVPAFAQSPDPAANAVVGGTSGAATGALIGCIVTIPIGCAPGAAVGAAVGGGVGATAGAATTPPAYYPPQAYDYPPPSPPAYVPLSPRY
jgi:hypothetical protein